MGIGFGINGSGQVAGWSTTVDDTARHAFIYSTGATIDLGSIGADGEVWSVNDRAEVTGGALAADGACTLSSTPVANAGLRYAGRQGKP